jgi:hypothetical protein
MQCQEVQGNSKALKELVSDNWEGCLYIETRKFFFLVMPLWTKIIWGKKSFSLITKVRLISLVSVTISRGAASLVIYHIVFVKFAFLEVSMNLRRDLGNPPETRKPC